MFLVFFYKIKIQNINVSILILMDSLLLYWYFNNHYITDVSILILLDSLLLFSELLEKLKETQLFQSLFYWILFFYKIIFYLLILKNNCFNPYSNGFSSFILFRWARIGPIYLGFQSLFYWILFSYKTKPKSIAFNAKVSILILLDSVLL